VVGGEGMVMKTMLMVNPMRLRASWLFVSIVFIGAIYYGSFFSYNTGRSQGLNNERELRNQVKQLLKRNRELSTLISDLGIEKTDDEEKDDKDDPRQVGNKNNNKNHRNKVTFIHHLHQHQHQHLSSILVVDGLFCNGSLISSKIFLFLLYSTDQLELMLYRIGVDIE